MRRYLLLLLPLLACGDKGTGPGDHPLKDTCWEREVYQRLSVGGSSWRFPTNRRYTFGDTTYTVVQTMEEGIVPLPYPDGPPLELHGVYHLLNDGRQFSYLMQQTHGRSWDFLEEEWATRGSGTPWTQHFSIGFEGKLYWAALDGGAFTFYPCEN